MKALALALLFSLPVPKIAPPIHQPVTETAVKHSRKGGKWYFAANGHAVKAARQLSILPGFNGMGVPEFV